jgi:hypothetical protein
VSQLRYVARSTFVTLDVINSVCLIQLNKFSGYNLWITEVICEISCFIKCYKIHRSIHTMYQALSVLNTEFCTSEGSVFHRFIIQHKVFLSNLITGDKIFVWWRVKILYWKAASSPNNAADLRLLSERYNKLLCFLSDHNRAAYQPSVITRR